MPAFEYYRGPDVTNCFLGHVGYAVVKGLSPGLVTAMPTYRSKSNVLDVVSRMGTMKVVNYLTTMSRCLRPLCIQW